MHTIGVAGGYDLYSVIKSRRLNKDVDSQSINLNRATIALFMVLVVVYCYLMPNDIIAKATSVFMGVTAAALLPAYFYSLYCEKPVKSVAVSSIVVGTVSYLFSALFLNAGTCIFLPICKLITGTNVLFPDTTLAYLDPLMIALPLSIITLVLAILVKKKEPNTMTCNNV
jgi:SSS family solute:Na+ symporter